MLQPPPDFQLTRVQQLSKQPKPIPLPAAEMQAEIEKQREQKPADTFAMFERVDKHAVDVSRVEHKNFRDLIWALIFARNINDDLEKVRYADARRVYVDTEDTLVVYTVYSTLSACSCLLLHVLCALCSAAPCSCGCARRTCIR